MSTRKRDVDSCGKNGKKVEFQQKLRQALTEEIDDLEVYLFEIPGAVNIIL